MYCLKTSDKLGSFFSDACNCKRGGPVVYHNSRDSVLISSLINKIVGVTSFGHTCKPEPRLYEKDVNGVYTGVHNYIDWIEGEVDIILKN